MSVVSNYIVEFGYKDFERRDSDLLEVFHGNLSEHTGYEFRPDIPRLHKSYNVYMGSKVLETNTYIYALNHVQYTDFVEAMSTAIQETKWSGGVQILWKSYDRNSEYWEEVFRQ